jgi:hypothetical protein
MENSSNRGRGKGHQVGNSGDLQIGANPVTSFGDFRDLDVWKHWLYQVSEVKEGKRLTPSHLTIQRLDDSTI